MASFRFLYVFTDFCCFINCWERVVKISSSAELFILHFLSVHFIICTFWSSIYRYLHIYNGYLLDEPTILLLWGGLFFYFFPPQIILFILKLILSGIISANTAILRLLFSGYIFFQLLNFILSVFIFKVHLLLTAVTWLFLFWSIPTISAF